MIKKKKQKKISALDRLDLLFKAETKHKRDLDRIIKKNNLIMKGIMFRTDRAIESLNKKKKIKVPRT